MSEPVSAPQPVSKAKVFARRLSSTLVLWGIVLGAMFSGSKLISDYVFAAFMVSLACVGLIEFYGLVEKRAMICFKKWGIAAGVLLMIGTFLHVTGHLGIHGSPARVNDF